MIKAITTAAFALALTTALAAAQSSQPQGGSTQNPASSTSQINRTPDTATGAMSSEKMGKSAEAHDAMKSKKKMKKMKKSKIDKMDAPASDGMKTDGMKK